MFTKHYFFSLWIIENARPQKVSETFSTIYRFIQHETIFLSHDSNKDINLYELSLKVYAYFMALTVLELFLNIKLRHFMGLIDAWCDTLCRCLLSGLFWFVRRWILLTWQWSLRSTLLTPLPCKQNHCPVNQNKRDNGHQVQLSQFSTCQVPPCQTHPVRPFCNPIPPVPRPPPLPPPSPHI